MWGHYADSHRGLCLQFECAPTSLFSLALKVVYQTPYPTASIITESAERLQEIAIYTKALAGAMRKSGGSSAAAHRGHGNSSRSC